MGSFNDYLELELLDHVWSAATFTAPATMFFGLWTTTLTDASTGSSGTEVANSNGYARQSLTNNATNFPAASAGAKSNGTAVTGWAASGGNWGTITDVGNTDSVTHAAGNMLGYDALTSSAVINDGDTAQIAVGDFDVTLN